MTTTPCWKCGITDEPTQPSMPTPGSGERPVILCPDCYWNWMGGDFTGPMAADDIDPRQASMFDLPGGTL